MKTVKIHVKIDLRVKEESQFIADEMGLTLSSIINATLKQLIRTREVSFAAHGAKTPYLEKLIQEARNDRNRFKTDVMELEDVLDIDPFGDLRRGRRSESDISACDD